jgi:outer membrane biosynthesis protein TonB
MRLSSGKRIGQSRQELATAVTFSFFLHIIFFLAAVFLYFTVKPRFHVPPFYEVKLVGPAADQSALPQMPPAVSKHGMKEAAKPKTKKNAHSRKEQKTLKKGEMPELPVPGQKPSKTEEAKAAEKAEQASPDTSKSRPAAPAEVDAEGVGMPVAQQDFKYGYYIQQLRTKIGQNWNPPPDAKDARCRVVFSVNRSGWVGPVNLDAEHSVGTFGFKQAAIRAIRASNPFPPLPEGFARQTLEFTVDLTAVQ